MGLELGGQAVGPMLAGAAILHASGDHFKYRPANSGNDRPSMRSMRTAGTLALLFIVLGAALSGCKTRSREEIMTDPALVYERAHRALMQGDYPLAIKVYEALMARYPFAAETRQSRLDVIYAYFKAGESESAIDAAETFIRENPTHPRIDYAWYMKGMTDFERLPNVLERWFHVDLNKRPPTEARRSFLSFSTVVEQFPNSEYAHDARRRMVYLRNRLADYEIAVANYYVARGAYVAAAQRAKVAIEEFDGSPAVRQALEIMVYCYDQMELKELAAQTRAMYRQNFEGEMDEGRKGSAKKKWYKLWLAS